jgi:hypothetical protein
MSIITSKGYIGIAKQGAKGSVNNTPDIFVKYLEESFQPEFDSTFDREGGDDENIVTGIKNLHKEKFSFKFKARPQIMSYIMTWLLGKDTVSGTGDPYTHVITRDSVNGRKWLTIRRRINTSYVLVYQDCKIESVTIEMEAGKSAMVTVEGNALTVTQDTTNDTPSYESIKPFVFYHGEGAFSIDGAVSSDIKKLTMKITVASQEGYQTDGLILADLPDLKLDGEFTAEFFATATDFFKKSVFNNTTTIAEAIYQGKIEFDLKTTENVADDREFKLTFEDTFWNPATGFNLKSEPEVMPISLSGILKKPTAGEIITATVKNSLSSDLG